MNLQLLQQGIEYRLEPIEKLLGPNYKLTLIANHNGANGLKDADILLTVSNRKDILRAVDKWLPASSDDNPVRAVSEIPSCALEHIRKLIVWGECLASHVPHDDQKNINWKTINKARIYYKAKLSQND